MSEPHEIDTDPNAALSAAALQAGEVTRQIEIRDHLIYEAWMSNVALRQIANDTKLSHMTIKRIIDRITPKKLEDKVNIRDTWSQYKPRYRSRPETYLAYEDVWRRDLQVRSLFSGWASFSQAANAEPAQSSDRVLIAEECMARCGYKLLPPTSRGGRRWGPR
jgi:hypothetical protein